MPSGLASDADGPVAGAFLWAAGVTAVEALSRRAIRGRAKAWLAAYSVIGAAAILHPSVRSVDRRRGAERRPGYELMAGLALVGAGYQVGRRLLGDRPTGPPPDSLPIEVAALAGVVAPVEELVWGGMVEPALGVPTTAALFAAKHVAIDGRWRRTLGLALFWTGLGLLRRRSPRLALAAHCAANAGAVALGHLSGRDRF